MSRKFLFLVCVMLAFLLVSGGSWAKSPSKTKQGPKTCVVHIQPMNGGVWPESCSCGGVQRNLPLLHRNNGDKIQFVIDSGPASCQLVFDDSSPLIQQGNPNVPADTITVYRTTGKNNYYVVSPKIQIPVGGYCSYWFHIIGNPPCDSLLHSCSPGKPTEPGKVEPCWTKGKLLQIGPGMEVSD